nr:hypothetical protein [Parafrankia soli]
MDQEAANGAFADDDTALAQLLVELAGAGDTGVPPGGQVDGQPRNLLGERLARAPVRVAEEPAYPQVHNQLPSANRSVGKPPFVPAVHPCGLDPTARTHGRHGLDSRVDTHHPLKILTFAELAMAV